MRSSTLLVLAAACVLAVFSPKAATGWQEAESGTSVEAEQGVVDLSAWVEVAVASAEPSKDGPVGSPSSCYFQQGNYAELMAWLENDVHLQPDPGEVYILKLCEVDQKVQLVTYWVYQPRPTSQSDQPTTAETTRLRNEVWGRLAISVPTILTAPSEVTVVQLPTYVWVSQADRTPVSETVTATVEGQNLSLTATAFPRRLGFLRVDMGDGNTLWCDADEVMAFDQSVDPLNQPSSCYHYYRRSSVDSPDLRYQVSLTAYWDVSVACTFNGRPCTSPPPAVPTQALTSVVHPIAVAELQALARPG